MPASYKVEFDWNSSGAFGGQGVPKFLSTSASIAYEDVSARLRQQPPLTATYGRDGAREFLPPVAGTMRFELDNTDGLFSSLNTNSALFGKLNPGIRVRATAILKTYRAIVMSQSPMGYWRLANASDEIGAYNGVFSGSPSSSSSALSSDSTDTAIDFVGGPRTWSDTPPRRIPRMLTTPLASSSSDQCMQATGFTMPSTAYTLEAWVKSSSTYYAESPPVRLPRMLTLGPVSNTYRGICGSWLSNAGAMLRISSTGRYELVHGNPATGSLASSSVPSGMWDHIVGTWDGSTLQLYVNGAQVSSLTMATPPGVGSGKFEIATWGDATAGTFLNAQIDEVAVYPSALSAEQIKRHFLYGSAFAFGPTHHMFDGHRDAPPELPGIRRQVVTESIHDGLAKLKSALISTEELVNQRIDVAIGKCLDEAGWSSSLRNITQARTTLVRWSVDRIDAFTAIRDLTFSEGPGANFYIDPKTGNFVWEHRHYRLLTDRCLTSRVKFRHDGIEPVFGSEFTYDTGVRNIVNACTVPVNTYSVGALSAIWPPAALSDISLSSGQTYQIEVSTSASWFTEAVNPTTAGGDYTLTGTPLASATLSRTSGKRARLTLVAGSGFCTISGLRVRAKPITVSISFETNSVSGAADNGVDYGIKTFPTEFLPSWLPDVETARDFCNYVVSRYRNPVPTVRFIANSESDARLAYALPLTVGDRIGVSEPLRSFIDGEFIIEQVTDVIGPRDMHQRIFTCEEASALQYWVLGDPVQGVLSTSSVLGY